jgi:hypothetical protein
MTHWVLINNRTGLPVAADDKIYCETSDKLYRVCSSIGEHPHKPNSTGKIHVHRDNWGKEIYYPGVLDCTWITTQESCEDTHLNPLIHISRCSTHITVSLDNGTDWIPLAKKEDEMTALLHAQQALQIAMSQIKKLSALVAHNGLVPTSDRHG